MTEHMTEQQRVDRSVVEHTSVVTHDPLIVGRRVRMTSTITYRDKRKTTRWTRTVRSHGTFVGERRGYLYFSDGKIGSVPQTSFGVMVANVRTEA